MTLLSGAGSWREKGSKVYVLANRLKKPFTISFNKPCLITLTIVAKEISFVSTRRSNNINRYIKKKSILFRKSESPTINYTPTDKFGDTALN